VNSIDLQYSIQLISGLRVTNKHYLLAIGPVLGLLALSKKSKID
jgi:hypothetical protein